MFPNASQRNRSDSLNSHAETLRQIMALSWTIGDQCSNFTDVVFRQFRAWVSRATSPLFVWASGRWNKSALCHHVVHVVRVSAQKQMCRIHALRIVAAVQDVKACWDVTVGNHPRDTMRQFGACANSETSIGTIGIARTAPQPAAIRTGFAINLRPEPSEHVGIQHLQEQFYHG